MLTDEQKMGVDKVISILKEAPADMFDMEGVFHFSMVEENHCGSPVCIGGWCAAHLYLENIKDPDYQAPDTSAAFREVTGLSGETAERVCFPWGRMGDRFDINPYDATRDQAIRLLEILRDTGEVDWVTAMS